MKKRLLAIALVISLMFTLAACTENKVQESSTTTAILDSTEAQSVDGSGTEEDTTAAEAVESTTVSEETTEELPEYTEVVRVGSLKGPTGFGISKLMDDVANGASSIPTDIQILPTPDELVPMVVKGELDFACVPTNLAAVLYNKTEGDITICAVNTLGVLHLVGTEEQAEKIQSIADLQGATLQATGQGAVPEYLLNHLIVANGLVVDEDVVVDYTQSHQELATAVAAGEVDLAMLPQPFATIAVMKGENVVEILDLDAEWQKVHEDTPITTGCMIVRNGFLEEHPEVVSAFLAEYESSIDWVNENPADASLLIEQYEIFPKAKVAEKAIPKCHMVYMDGEEMKANVSDFLSILYDANPKSVGGTMPEDDFYRMDE